jgi:hypothetical protein
MNIKELENVSYFHDEEIESMVYDEEKKTLKINCNYCEWHLEDLEERNIPYKKIEMLFVGVERFLSYADIETIIKDENSIDFINIKEKKSLKKCQVTFGFDHYVPYNPKIQMEDWFFIEFLATEVFVTQT